MNVLHRHNFDQLLTVADKPCISVYLRTHSAGKDTREDPIRLKNLLGECEKRLKNTGIRTKEIETLLQPARELLDNPEFWMHRQDGLAIFLSKKGMEYYDLPYDVASCVQVSDAFYIKPLIPMLHENHVFYVLVLSQGCTKLFEATRWHIAEKSLPARATSLEEFLKYDVAEEHIQLHTTPQGSSVGSDAVFHGQGNAADGRRHKEDVERYVNFVRQAVEKELDARSAPLLLAGVDFLQSMYRRHNTYGNLLERSIEGNPEPIDSRKLQSSAFGLVEPYFQGITNDRLARYRGLSNSEQTSSDIAEIVAGAEQGRIATLLVDATESCWDEPEEGRRVDLLDLAARLTFTHGGEAYATAKNELPSESPAVAIFRY